MNFPLLIFTLLGFVLSIFTAFLIYSIFYPEAIENPLIIWTKFYSNLVVIKHKLFGKGLSNAELKHKWDGNKETIGVWVFIVSLLVIFVAITLENHRKKFSQIELPTFRTRHRSSP